MNGLTTYIKRFSKRIESLRDTMLEPSGYWNHWTSTGNHSEIIYESYWNDDGKDPLTAKDWTLFALALIIILLSVIQNL